MPYNVWDPAFGKTRSERGRRELKYMSQESFCSKYPLLQFDYGFARGTGGYRVPGFCKLCKRYYEMDGKGVDSCAGFVQHARTIGHQKAVGMAQLSTGSVEKLCPKDRRPTSFLALPQKSPRSRLPLGSIGLLARQRQEKAKPSQIRPGRIQILRDILHGHRH